MPSLVIFLAAVACEVTATLTLRHTDGFTRLWPTAVVVVGYGVSFVLLAQLLKTGVPVAIVYASWSALGIAAVSLIGAVFLDERLTPVQILAVVAIVIAVVTLEVSAQGS